MLLWATEPDPRGARAAWLDAVHPADRPAAAAALRRAVEGEEALEHECRLRRADGGYGTAIVVAEPRFAQGAYAGHAGAVVDVTARERVVQDLREREARLRALFSSIDEGYCLAEIVLGAEGRAVDYRFLEANPRFEAMTGLRDPVGRTALELVPDLEPSWLETYARVALDGEPLRFESGSEAMGRWFDVYATPVRPRGRFALIFRDVTRRRTAERALQEREAAERRARRQAELLSEISRELAAVERIDARVRRVVDLLVPRVADYARIEVRTERGPVVAEAHRDAGTAALAAAGELPVRLELPLDTGVHGRELLVLGAADPERSLGPAEEGLAREIADRVGVVVARARVREEEHQIAVRLQRTLLPGSIAHRPGVEVAARYDAGSALLEVGGDWYDAFTLPDGRVALTVGDVIGHGLEAAAAMGRLRTALVALAPHADGPGRLLSLLDGFAAGTQVPDFATACCAMLDPASGELRYASAGHPPILAVSPAGDAAWLEEGRSPPLFGEVVPDRAEAAVTLAPGTLLVLYSDGLVERRREPLPDALARLGRVAVAARDMPVDELVGHLVAELGVRNGRDDDVVVLCLRLAAAPPRLHRSFTARPAELRKLRAALRAWMAGRRIVEPAASTLLLALGEACANAIEHAYAGREPGPVDVEVVHEDGEVLVQVRDAGCWRPPGQVEYRGRGTGIIEALASGLTRRTEAEGTTVAFRLPVGAGVLSAGSAPP